MPRFKVTITTEQRYNIELAQAVLDAVDDDWRANFYDLNTPEDIAAYIARNMRDGLRLSRLDGWGDQPDSNARLEPVDEYEDSWAEAI